MGRGFFFLDLFVLSQLAELRLADLHHYLKLAFENQSLEVPEKALFFFVRQAYFEDSKFVLENNNLNLRAFLDDHVILGLAPGQEELESTL